MTLRLVLVSLVAALGLTIPGAPMIESWVASTQNWMNARFADWDTRNPEVADYVIVSDYYDAGQFASRRVTVDIPAAEPAPSLTSTGRSEAPGAVATQSVSSKPPVLPDTRATVIRTVSISRKMPVFEPIELAERLELGPAERLNRMNEGLGIVPSRLIKTMSSRRQVEPIALVQYFYRGIGVKLTALNNGMHDVRGRVVRWAASQRKQDTQPIRVFEDLYGGSAPRRERKLEVAVAKPSLPAPLAVRTANAAVLNFGLMESCPSLYFAGELTATTTKASANATTAAVKPAAPAPKVAVKPPAPAVKPAAPAPKVAVKTPAPSVKPEAPAPKVAVKPPVPAAKPEAPAPKVAVKTPAPSVKPAAPAPKVAVKPPAPSVKPEAPAPKVAVKPPVPAAKPAAPASKVAVKAVTPVSKPTTSSLKVVVRTASVPAAKRPSADELMENPDLEYACISPVDDGFGTVTGHPVIASSRAKVSDHFEPLRSGDCRCTGIAHERNRRNEGLSLPASSVAKVEKLRTSPPQASPDLTRAMRLTREAVFAWVNVFKGPTTVTVSQPRQRF